MNTSVRNAQSVSLLPIISALQLIAQLQTVLLAPLIQILLKSAFHVTQTIYLLRPGFHVHLWICSVIAIVGLATTMLWLPFALLAITIKFLQALTLITVLIRYALLTVQLSDALLIKQVQLLFAQPVEIQRSLRFLKPSTAWSLHAQPAANRAPAKPI